MCFNETLLSVQAKLEVWILIKLRKKLVKTEELSADKYRKVSAFPRNKRSADCQGLVVGFCGEKKRETQLSQCDSETFRFRLKKRYCYRIAREKGWGGGGEIKFHTPPVIAVLQLREQVNKGDQHKLMCREGRRKFTQVLLEPINLNTSSQTISRNAELSNVVNRAAKKNRTTPTVQLRSSEFS